MGSFGPCEDLVCVSGYVDHDSNSSTPCFSCPIGTYNSPGTVVSAAGLASFTASGLAAFADGWFTAGRLLWTSGANAGLSVEVKTHAALPAAVRIDLWQAMPEGIAAGDAFTVTAGCDKRFETCRDRFSNVINFGGFPHMPGNDYALSYANQSDRNDGGSLNG